MSFKNSSRANKESDSHKGKTQKAQSAFEYLITYGWAILVLAGVLVLLFKLGVFTVGNYAPRLNPGGCQISKPIAQGSPTLATMTGICNGELPLYVALFRSDYTEQIIVPYKFFRNQSFTLLGWIYWTPGTIGSSSKIGYAYGGQTGSGTDNGIAIINSNGNFRVEFNGDAKTCASGSAYAGVWYQYGVSWSNTTHQANIWVNGTQACQFQTNGNIIINDNLYLGGSLGTWIGTAGYTSGYLANIQLYNQSLTQSQVSQLFLEGVGGVPLSPEYMEGWWPLNGNPNDYSGDGFNGAANGIAYSTTWINTYKPS